MRRNQKETRAGHPNPKTPPPHRVRSEVVLEDPRGDEQSKKDGEDEEMEDEAGAQAKLLAARIETELEQ